MEKKKKIFKKRYKFLIMFLILLSFTVLWARYVGTIGLITKEYKIVNTNLPISFDGLKVVHFSDLHYGRTTTKDELLDLVTKINLLKPDIIVFTGDLIDRDTTLTKSMEKEIISILSKSNAKYGKYFLKGNHDIKFKNYMNIMEVSGFTNANNTFDIIYSENNEKLFICGLESEVSGKPDFTSISTYLKDSTAELPSYKILLLHTPDTYDEVKDNSFNLVLAGHSHNGQVRLPFVGALITPEGAKKYYKEFYKIGNTDMYISSGIGTSVASFRLFNHPSFNFYRITKK